MVCYLVSKKANETAINSTFYFKRGKKNLKHEMFPVLVKEHDFKKYCE